MARKRFTVSGFQKWLDKWKTKEQVLNVLKKKKITGIPCDGYSCLIADLTVLIAHNLLENLSKTLMMAYTQNWRVNNV